MPTKISIILSYFNHGDLLNRHLDAWNSFSEDIKNEFEFIIVDDCSHKIHLKKIDNSRCFRITDDIFFNLPGSRNLGVQMAKSDYIMICDMDTIVTSECAYKLLDLIPKTNVIYKFNRFVRNNKSHPKHYKIHPGIFLVNRQSYLNVFGCDEDFAGSYGNYTRSLEYKLVSQKAFKILECSEIFVEYIPEGDCDINKDKNVNRKLFNKKVKNDSWSVDMLRFKWTELK